MTPVSARARAGASVALAARRREKLEETAELVRQAGGSAICLDLDVTDADSIHTCFAELNDVAFDGRQAYYEYARAEAGLAVANFALDAAASQREETEALVAAGSHRQQDQIQSLVLPERLVGGHQRMSPRHRESREVGIHPELRGGRVPARQLRPPRRRVRGGALHHRRTQEAGADLEEGTLARRFRVGPGGPREGRGVAPA